MRNKNRIESCAVVPLQQRWISGLQDKNIVGLSLFEIEILNFEMNHREFCAYVFILAREMGDKRKKNVIITFPFEKKLIISDKDNQLPSFENMFKLG